MHRALTVDKHRSVSASRNKDVDRPHLAKLTGINRDFFGAVHFGAENFAQLVVIRLNKKRFVFKNV